MIKTKLISCENNTCKFFTEEGKEIVTSRLNSLVVGATYLFQTNVSGFSTIKDEYGNTYNILVN